MFIVVIIVITSAITYLSLFFIIETFLNIIILLAFGYCKLLY